MDGTIKQRTLENHEYVVRKHKFPELGAVKIKTLKPDRVRRLYRKKMDEGLSSHTVQLIHTVVRKVLHKPYWMRFFLTTCARRLELPDE